MRPPLRIDGLPSGRAGATLARVLDPHVDDLRGVLADVLERRETRPTDRGTVALVAPLEAQCLLRGLILPRAVDPELARRPLAMAWEVTTLAAAIATLYPCHREAAEGLPGRALDGPADALLVVVSFGTDVCMAVSARVAAAPSAPPPAAGPVAPEAP